MPHLTHSCRCGKTIHWPKAAKIGDTWKCRRCGTTSVLSDHGQQGVVRGSRPNASDNNPDFQSAPSGGGGGCLVILSGVGVGVMMVVSLVI
jgi:hypothetical protein